MQYILNHVQVYKTDTPREKYEFARRLARYYEEMQPCNPPITESEWAEFKTYEREYKALQKEWQNSEPEYEEENPDPWRAWRQRGKEWGFEGKDNDDHRGWMSRGKWLD